MKIGMKEEMGIADEMRSSNLESRAQYTLLRAKRAQRALRAPLPCFLLYTDVKIGMNIQWDKADD